MINSEQLKLCVFVNILEDGSFSRNFLLFDHETFLSITVMLLLVCS
jgi:hypothetical protein